MDRKRIIAGLKIQAKRKNANYEETRDYFYIVRKMLVRVNKETIRCEECFVGETHLYLDDDWKFPISGIKSFLPVFMKE